MPETRIVNKLKNTSAVTDLISDRIRCGWRREAWGTSDALTYQRISTAWSNHATGTTTLYFVRVQIDLFSSTALGCRALANAVRTALGGWSDDASTPVVTMCHLENQQDMPVEADAAEEETEFRIVQDWLLHCHN